MPLAPLALNSTDAGVAKAATVESHVVGNTSSKRGVSSTISSVSIIANGIVSNSCDGSPNVILRPMTPVSEESSETESEDEQITVQEDVSAKEVVNDDSFARFSSKRLFCLGVDEEVALEVPQDRNEGEEEDTDRTPTPATLRLDHPSTRSEPPALPEHFATLGLEGKELFPTQEARRKLELQTRQILAGAGRTWGSPATPPDDSDGCAANATGALVNTNTIELQPAAAGRQAEHEKGGGNEDEDADEWLPQEPIDVLQLGAETLLPDDAFFDIPASASSCGGEHDDLAAHTLHASKIVRGRKLPMSRPRSWPASPDPLRPPTRWTPTKKLVARRPGTQSNAGADGGDVFRFPTDVHACDSRAPQDCSIEDGIAGDEAIDVHTMSLAQLEEGSLLARTSQQMRELIHQQCRKDDELSACWYSGRQEELFHKMAALRARVHDEQRTLARRLRDEFLACERLRESHAHIRRSAEDSISRIESERQEELEKHPPLTEELHGAALFETQLRAQLEEECAHTWRCTAEVGRALARSRESQALLPQPEAILNLLDSGSLDVASRSATVCVAGMAKEPLSGSSHSSGISGTDWLSRVHKSEEQVTLEQQCSTQAKQITELSKEIALEKAMCEQLGAELVDTATRSAVVEEQLGRRQICDVRASDEGVVAPSSIDNSRLTTNNASCLDYLGTAEVLLQTISKQADQCARFRTQSAQSCGQLAAQRAEIADLRKRLHGREVAQRNLENDVKERRDNMNNIQCEVESQRLLLKEIESKAGERRTTLLEEMSQQKVELQRRQNEVRDLLPKPPPLRPQKTPAYLDSSKTELEDIWDVTICDLEDSWVEKTVKQKFCFVTLQALRCICTLLLLYTFIISLSLMGSAFQILGGPTAGSMFRNQDLFSSPIAGLVVGMLVTVLVQSSSTSTSILITMTAAGLMEVRNAIPMVMGANIGTSVTNTIVSVAHVGNREEYTRAFAGATIHDCFNLLSVFVLLPLEVFTGLLGHAALGAVNILGISDSIDKHDKIDFLKRLTKPVSSRIIHVDKKLVSKVAKESDPERLSTLVHQSMIKQSRTTETHLFMDTPLSDSAAGWILLVASIVLMSTSLVMLTKILQSIFKGHIAVMMRSVFNLEFKRVPCLADYVLMLFGMIATILMQSSSVTTSTLTPLVGIGLIKIDKMFPFTVGANIGTTVTGILAALASDNVRIGMEVAFSHFFFNLFGAVLWFPVPLLRRIPIRMAVVLGTLAGRLRWFPLAYIVYVFCFAPGVLLAASMFTSFGHLAVLLFLVGLLLLGVAIVACLFLGTRRASLVLSSAAVDASGTPSRNSTTTGPIIWAAACVVIVCLMLSVPNAQWANLHFATFDGREHVGIGLWEVCSAMYTSDMPWASPWSDACSSSQLEACGMRALEKTCEGNWHFPEEAGSNVKYEVFWTNCSRVCSPDKWHSHCVELAGCDSAAHVEQCTNVSRAVGEYDSAASMTYGDNRTSAWSEGSKCRPISQICDNGMILNLVGYGALLGGMLVAICVIVLLMHRCWKKHPTFRRRSLLVAFMAITLAWLALTLALGGAVAVTQKRTTCLLAHGSGRGAVMVTGAFEDIVTSNGICYWLLYGSWVATTVMVIFLLAHHKFARCGKMRGEDDNDMVLINP